LKFDDQNLSFNENETITSTKSPSDSHSTESIGTQESNGKHRAIANIQINMK